MLFAMPASAAGVCSVPPALWNTTVADVPDCSGKRDSSRSIAVWDSAPGIVKLSKVWPPLALANATIATAATIHTAMTSQ